LSFVSFLSCDKLLFYLAGLLLDLSALLAIAGVLPSGLKLIGDLDFLMGFITLVR